MTKIRIKDLIEKMKKMYVCQISHGSMDRLLHRIDTKRLMTICIGVVYLWFGALKFVPNLSPAEPLAKETITIVTFGLIAPSISIILLAIIEIGIGLLLILKFQTKKVILVALWHMLMTFTPFLFFPELTFTEVPYAFSLLGQYIFKNIIIVCSLLIIYPTKQ